MNSLTTQIKASRTYPVAIAILTALVLVVVFGGSQAKAYPSGAHLFSDNWAGQPSGLLSTPYDTAIDPDTGNVYVADTGNNRIQVFTTNGVYVSQFGSYGNGNGELNTPTGIDIASGRVMVADSGNDRVQVFSTSGQFIYKFGSTGSGAQQFQKPLGVAALQDNSGNLAGVMVADTNNSRISVWIAVGAYNDVPTWFGNIGSGSGSANGQFSQPFGVDTRMVYNDGSPCGQHAEMVVADYGNSRVQRFVGSNGNESCIGSTFPSNYSNKWSIGGQPYKAKFGPSNDNVYTATSVGTPITVNNALTGAVVTTWGSSGTGDGQFRFARGLSVNSNQVFVADGNNNRIQRFSLTGTFETKWGITQNGDGEFGAATDVFQDSTGNIYVVDTNNSRIQKFNSSGRLLTKWGSNGNGDGQFNNPLGGGYDPTTDRVWIADTSNNRVQIFNTSGVFQTKFGTGGNGNSQFNGPRDIAFIGSAAYVLDGGNNRVQVFNAANQSYTTQWGSTGNANGQFSFASSLASAGGYLYVSDSDRVQKFNFGGGFVTSIAVQAPSGLAWSNDELLVAKAGSGTILNYLAPNANPTTIAAPYEACASGDGNGQLSNPQGISPINNTTFYVADTGNNRVVKNSISGLHIGTDPTTCETAGALGNSQFVAPRGIASASNGEIYVADQGANRVVRYDPSGSALSRWGMGGGPEGFAQPSAVAVGADGNVVVADNSNLRRFSNVGAQINSIASTGTRDLAVGNSNDVYRLTTTGVTRYNSSLVSQGSWGSSGSGNSQFINASGIATDSSGNVYVADTGNNRIQKFSPTGTYISQTATTSPADVAIGPSDERVYALQQAPATVRTYTQAGTAIESFGSTGAGNGQFSNPLAFTVTPSGRVAVSDLGNARVELLDFTNSRTLYDSKITDYGGNELTVPAIPSTTVTGGF